MDFLLQPPSRLSFWFNPFFNILLLFDLSTTNQIKSNELRPVPSLLEIFLFVRPISSHSCPTILLDPALSQWLSIKGSHFPIPTAFASIACNASFCLDLLWFLLHGGWIGTLFVRLLPWPSEYLYKILASTSCLLGEFRHLIPRPAILAYKACRFLPWKSKLSLQHLTMIASADLNMILRDLSAFNMGRGAYDTTGVKKPDAPPRPK